MSKGLLDLDFEALEFICGRLTGNEVVRLGGLCRTLRRVVKGLRFLPPVNLVPQPIPNSAAHRTSRYQSIIPGFSKEQYSSWVAFLAGGGNAQLSEVAHAIEGSVLVRDISSGGKSGESNTSKYFDLLLKGGLRSLSMALLNDKADRALSLLLRMAFTPSDRGSANDLRQLRISCQGDVRLLSPRLPLVCRPDASIELTASGGFLLVGFPRFKHCPLRFTISAVEVQNQQIGDDPDACAALQRLCTGSGLRLLCDSLVHLHLEAQPLQAHTWPSAMEAIVASARPRSRVRILTQTKFI